MPPELEERSDSLGPAPGVSEMAREFLNLPERVQRQIGVPVTAVIVWDGIVTAARLVLDEGAGRPALERLGDFVESRLGQVTPDRVDDFVAELTRITESKQIPDWAHRLTRPEFLAAVERGAGTATYHRLRRAATRDFADVAKIVQRLTRFLQPYSVALEDMIRLIDGQQRKQIVDALGPTGAVVVAFAIQIDRLVGNVLDAALSDQLTTDVFTKLHTPSPEEIAAVIPSFREVIADRSRVLAEELGAAVARKMKGARDAVTLSADPVSQAANSLIEMIDRLLRSAFTEQEVLDWVDQNYPDDGQLRYVKDGNVRPTKLAQARCFVFAGEPRGTQPGFGELIAGVLVNARSELQRLKHADTGEPEELNELGRLMGAIEGFFAMGVRLAWSQSSDASLSELYRRIDPKRHVEESGDGEPGSWTEAG